MRGPAAYEVGAKLYAKDKGGYYYAAKIMKKTADQPAKEVLERGSRGGRVACEWLRVQALRVQPLAPPA